MITVRDLKRILSRGICSKNDKPHAENDEHPRTGLVELAWGE
jgi:hypothetical protein